MLSAIMGGACRDSFTRIGLVEKFSSLAVEKEELTFFVLRCLVTIPRPLRERVEFLSELCELRNSGVGLNQKLTPTAPLCEGKLFSDTLSLCSRYRFENLSFASFRLNLTSLTSPRPLREREQSCSSRQAKATNAGVGVTQEHLQSAPQCSRKLFSDTLPLCSRYRFENLSFASFRLNLTSLTSPRPLREGVNVLGWLVTFPRPLREREQSCLSHQAKATNAGVGLKTIIHEYPPTVSDHFPLKGGQMPALAINKLRIPLPIRGERSNSSNLLRHSESSIYSGAKNL